MLYNHFNRIKNFILDLLSTNKRVGITGNLTTTIGMTPVPTPKIPNGNTTTNVENKPSPTSTLATNRPTSSKPDKPKKTIKKKSIKNIKKKGRKK